VLTSCGVSPSSVFNPSFVNVLDSSGTGENAGIQNATGHTPIIFVNKTRFDPQLTNYLGALNAVQRLGGLAPGSTNLRDLRPRVRLRLRITFDDGNFMIVEFVDGDTVIEVDVRDTTTDEEGNDQVLPLDPTLSEDTLSRVVAACGVARVEVEGDPQVFLPVFVRTIRVDVGDQSGEEVRVLVNTDVPRFWPVLPDEVDADLNVTLLRNYGFREAPAAARNLGCGTGVGIVISGTVKVPFTAPENNPEDEFIQGRSEVPGFVNTDDAAQASTPGRYEFLVRSIP